MDALLLLEDGTQFRGEGFGGQATSIGEVVFHTGMTGYEEVLTDPSYKGQMVVMTYPHIGNTGINGEDGESSQSHVEGFIVREACFTPSNYRTQHTLDAYLKDMSIPGIHRIDTRKLTRIIRERGAMMGILTTEELDVEGLTQRLKDHPSLEKRDLVQGVSVEKPERWSEGVATTWYTDAVRPLGKKRLRVVAFDFGIKRNILRLMTTLGFDATLVPAKTSASAVRDMSPDGIFLSNGPGDPEGVGYAVECVKDLIGYRPIFGICLGHQILGLALGAKTRKLSFGHHGSNHPVKNMGTGEIEITAQNHNFVVRPETLEGAGLEVTHINLNDGTVEGMRHRELPIFSVQYHPEASPGPHDSVYLFRQFYELMESSKERGQ